MILICLFQYGSEYIEWNPLHIGENDSPRIESPDKDWTVVNTVSYRKDNVGAAGESNDKQDGEFI